LQEWPRASCRNLGMLVAPVNTLYPVYSD